jgi:hypothetical protein
MNGWYVVRNIDTLSKTVQQYGKRLQNTWLGLVAERRKEWEKMKKKNLLS